MFLGVLDYRLKYSGSPRVGTLGEAEAEYFDRKITIHDISEIP